MNLFNEFHSRVFQFVLDVWAILQQKRSISRSELDELAAHYGFDYAEQILNPLCDMRILSRSGQTYKIGDGFRVPAVSLNRMEQDYLQYILRMPEAALFLDEVTVQKLHRETATETLQKIQYYAPQGELLPNRPENVRLILRAIREKRLIRYQYVTRTSDTPLESVTMPWKLEYSAYDRRWWVILYDQRECCTIKARLDNLANIRLDAPSTVTDKEMETAMEQLLEPEPVVLQVDDQRGALERCFLVFENQLFEETRRLSDDRYELKFRFYRFDRREILRQLLYLGPHVKLIEPESMRQELAKLLDQALET